MFKYIVPLIALGAAAFFFKGSRKLKNLDTAVTRLVYKSIDITKLRFELDLNVINPGKESLSIQEIELALVYRGETIANMVKRGLSILVEGEKTVKIKNITADVSLLTALSQVLSYFLGDSAKTITVAGTIKADGFNYPVDETINL